MLGPQPPLDQLSSQRVHIGGQQILWVESLDPSVHSFGISPFVQNAFFPIATVHLNMISMDLTFGKGLFLKVNALGHAYMWTTDS